MNLLLPFSSGHHCASAPPGPFLFSFSFFLDFQSSVNPIQDIFFSLLLFVIDDISFVSGSTQYPVLLQGMTICCPEHEGMEASLWFVNQGYCFLSLFKLHVE